MNIRLIATDIDGTILPPGGAVSPATRHVVAQCRLKNIPFVICSGRWYPNAHATALDAGLSGSDYLLAVNGNLRQHRTIAEASAVESPIRQETIGFPAHFFARAHNFKPPGRACQPEADSPMRT